MENRLDRVGWIMVALICGISLAAWEMGELFGADLASGVWMMFVVGARLAWWLERQDRADVRQ